MKKQTNKKQTSATALKRFTATAVLIGLLAGTHTGYAQDPSMNQAELNFVGADVESVIKAIGHYTNTTFIIDPRVKGTINLVSEKPVNKAQALNLLGSVLRMQGYALVKGDTFTKVVPEADGKIQAVPTQSGIRGDHIATQIYRLSHESAPNMVAVLRPLISPNNTINANPGNNTIVITDYADNLARLSKIIAAMDVPASAEVDVIPVKHGFASDIAVMVNRLLDQGGGPAQAGGDAGRLSVLADARTNSLLLRAPSEARANLARSLIAKLDQPTSQPGNVHVVYLRNAEAVKLAQTLRAVVGGESGTAGVANQSTQAPAASSAQSSMLGSTQSQGGSTGIGSGMATTQNTQTQQALPTGGAGSFIQADPTTNTLIITASEPVFRNLRAVIDQLDSRRAQVYVESLIVEVSADKMGEFGVQWLGLSGNSGSSYRVGGGTSFATGGNNLVNLATGKGQVLPGSGLTLGIFKQTSAGQLGLGAVAHALETEIGANILSVPNLITLDNEEARIIVGQNVPFVTGQYTTQASAGSAGVNPFQTIERRDIGLALKVRPQISEGGTIKLGIYQETSAVQDTTNPAGIITSKRAIESNVLVDDGQIIVLGGLMEDRLEDGEEKVPGLGDVPVVGNLFKYQKRKRTKTNLMVFLRPTVIRSAEQSASVAADRYDYIRGVQMSQKPTDTMLLPNAEAPELPALLDGKPVGGKLLNVAPQTQGNAKASEPEVAK